jgi:hypothetical protein
MKRLDCILLTALAAGPTGCQDTVDPGFYAPDDPDSALATPAQGAGSSTGPEAAKPGDPGGSSDAATTDPTSEADGEAPADGFAPGKPRGPCDLTGRWLVTLRTVTDALGTSQAAHEWYFFELAQSGAQLTVAKGLVCGKNVRALSAASGNADFPKAWPAMMTKMSYAGHKGTSAPSSGGCSVAFDTSYEVIGATESYYENPSETLPTVSQQASGSSPGWEDWDGDGQPGYTMSITGLASGQIYMVDRTTYTLSGTVPASGGTFDLAVDWKSDQDVLGVNGPPILSMTTSAVKDSNPAQHFATFARLTDGQATGTDAAVCSAIRSLAPMLAPKASN